MLSTLSIPKESVCISTSENSLKTSRFERVIIAINENLKLFEDSEVKETKILVNTVRQIIKLAV